VVVLVAVAVVVVVVVVILFCLSPHLIEMKYVRQESQKYRGSTTTTTTTTINVVACEDG